MEQQRKFPKEQRTHFLRDAVTGERYEVATAAVVVRSRRHAREMVRPGCKFTKKQRRMALKAAA